MKDRCEDEIPLKRPARHAAGIPRITRLMALAIKFQEMIDRREVKDYAELARLGFITWPQSCQTPAASRPPSQPTTAFPTLRWSTGYTATNCN